MSNVDPDTLVKSFLANARENEVAVVVVFSHHTEKGTARRSVATNLPDAAAQALTGHLIKTDSAALEAAARQMLATLAATAPPGAVPTFEKLPEEMRTQLLASAADVLSAAANSGNRQPVKSAIIAPGEKIS